MVATVRAVVWLCLCLCTCQVRGMYVPQKMNRTIDNLLKHYNISKTERFSGKPVFSKEMLKGNAEVAEKRLLISRVLEVYENMIGKMLKQTVGTKEGLASASAMAAASDGGGTNAAVREELDYLLEMIQKLRTSHYQKEEELLQEFHELSQIQMDSAVVQSKSLWELLWFYEKASSLAETSNHQRKQRRRRRRRQTPWVKRRPKI